MRNVTSHVGSLRVVKQLSNSKNGNPRYLLSVAGWSCRTAVDSMLAYDIQNLNGKAVAAHIGTHYGKATLLSVVLTTNRNADQPTVDAVYLD